MIGRLKRWLPGFLVLLGTLIGIGLAARKASKKTQQEMRHEAKAETHRRNNRLREADAETQKANDARTQADEARATTERRMKEAAEHEGTVADAIARYNERMRDIRADPESVDGTGTGL